MAYVVVRHEMEFRNIMVSPPVFLGLIEAVHKSILDNAPRGRSFGGTV